MVQNQELKKSSGLETLGLYSVSTPTAPPRFFVPETRVAFGTTGTQRLFPKPKKSSRRFDE
jgi:hypothetical protein